MASLIVPRPVPLSAPHATAPSAAPKRWLSGINIGTRPCGPETCRNAILIRPTGWRANPVGLVCLPVSSSNMQINVKLPTCFGQKGQLKFDQVPLNLRPQKMTNWACLGFCKAKHPRDTEFLAFESWTVPFAELQSAEKTPAAPSRHVVPENLPGGVFRRSVRKSH